MPGANMLRETADFIECGVCHYQHERETLTMNADTIARKLANTNPWAYDESTSHYDMPQHECKFCFWRKPFNEYGMYNMHDPACLWVAAARYADAPTASQEAADSPIEARVGELLGETEIDPEIAAAHQAIPTWRLV